jgi:hypothetical protein
METQRKKCSSCGAEVTYDGSHGCSVTCGRDAVGANIAVQADPYRTVPERFKQGICPCCTAQTLVSS